MVAKYYGQSCVEFDVDGTKILIDPFIRYNPLAQGVDISVIRPDYIFLSHGHQDHVADMLPIQKQSQAKVAAVVETAEWVRRQGVDEESVIEFNLGGTLQLPFGRVKMVYAAHSNSTPDGAYGGFPVGFVFFLAGQTIYFSGDTALTMEMKLLERYKIDWAFLRIGCHYTMDAEDAALATTFMNCKKVIGVHYDTFPPIQIDKEQAKKAFAEVNAELTLLDIGQEISLS